ncbi:MAG: LamG domain-containing protein [Verrucomicrobia bacterium]|nr:LamG domain-containing protein [Verrucomicrobiota bacterium]
MQNAEFEIQGSGFGVQSLELRIQNSELNLQHFHFAFGIRYSLPTAWQAGAFGILLCLCAFAPLCLLPRVAAADKDLLVHYRFDEGSGDLAKDQSGNNQDATIHGAEFVRLKKGCAMKFNGVDDFVDCGKSPDLEITDVISVEAWVNPERADADAGEGLIVAKGAQDAYALTYYHADGRVWWYISGGDNACAASVPVDQWSHLVGTFDGRELKLYVNGELKNSKSSKYPTIQTRTDLNLSIGRHPFRGMIDEARVYHRALTPEDVQKHYQTEAEDRLAAYAPVKDGVILRGNGFTLAIGLAGGMELRSGNESYLFASGFSYPGARIGTHFLSQDAKGAADWTPSLKQLSTKQATISGKGKHYSLQRSVKLDEEKITIADALTNLSAAPVGIMVRHRVVTPAVFKRCLLGGLPENTVADSGANPTLFVAGDKTSVGVVAEDDISRVRFEATAALNNAAFGVNHFGLAAGQSHTLEWTIYPLGRDADYFTLVNRLREAWRVNFTVDALMDYGSLRPDEWAAPAVLAEQLRRKPLHYVALTPFLDYPSENALTRAEFKALAQATIPKLRAAQPDLKFLGSIEASLVGIREKMARNNEQLKAFLADTKGLGDIARTFGVYPPLPDAMSRLIENAGLPWKDSLVRTPDGRIFMEIYHPKESDRPVTALVVVPSPGNYQEKFLMEQVKFLIEEVGLDGVYFDTWGWGPDYTKWDGLSVDIDPASGQILRKHTDTHLATAKVRLKIARDLLARGKAMFLNGGNALVRADQDLPIVRLIENDIAPFKAGEKPPLNARMVKCQLGSPVVMMGEFGGAAAVYRAVITYLRHGVLCSYYNTRFPEDGDGSGEYGPFRHMYPITPVALHEGWIEGKERIITCVSGEYLWKGQQQPVLCLFDSEGRTKQHAFHCEKTKAGWSVQVKLEDWREIGVIEETLKP